MISAQSIVPTLLKIPYVDVVSDPRMYVMKTLPKSLTVKTSSIPDTGLGVFAKEKIKINSRFGPFKEEKIEFKETPDGRSILVEGSVVKLEGYYFLSRVTL